MKEESILTTLVAKSFLDKSIGWCLWLAAALEHKTSNQSFTLEETRGGESVI